MRRSLAFFVLLLLAPIAKQAEAVEVAVHLRRGGQSSQPAFTGLLIAESASESGPRLTIPLPVDSITLTPGDWFVSARIEGEWSERRLVSVHEDPQSVELQTVPLAQLTARVSVASGKEPHELKTSFQRVSIEGERVPLEGNVVCAVEDGVATCNLPAGHLDLAFHIPGFVSRYRWNAALTSRAVLDAGTLHFVPGSTLSGRVEVSQHRGVRLDRASVIVKPSLRPGANGEERHRNDTARLTAHPNRRGLFTFDLPPGRFTLQASYTNLISEELEVDVAAGREAILREPLRLEPQRSVTVRVHPALDPWSRPWTIEFASVDPSGFLLSERGLKASLDGTCQFNNVLPGPHRLTVVRARDQSWASRMFDVDRDTTMDINVDVIRITGAIHIGTKPLAATATLSSFEPDARVTFQSKPDGTFAARLPAPEHDTWDEIKITADHPPVELTLQHVRFQRHDDGSAELNIDLPARTLSGTVVDDLGNITAPAVIDVLSPDNSLQQVISNDGSFMLTGLPSGRYRLRAASKELESIDLQDVVLTEEQDAASDVVLPVVPNGHLRGSIRALDGPVPGAALFATRPGDHTRPIILSQVDPEGHFDIRFPGGTSDVVVAINAPGFAFRLTKTLLRNDEQTFAVEQNGGELSVDTPATHAGFRPYLMHDGAIIGAAIAGYVAGASFQANLAERMQFRIASVEPGTYSLCWLAEERTTVLAAAPPCISGVVAPHGSLTLADNLQQAGSR
jgi:hypothetical protein